MTTYKVTFGNSNREASFDTMNDAVAFTRDLPEVAHVNKAVITHNGEEYGWLNGTKLIWIEILAVPYSYCQECGGRVKNGHCPCCRDDSMIATTNRADHVEHLEG